jgi:ABC-type transporter Mla MlaB component
VEPEVDLSTVDALARLRLAAGRAGIDLRVRDAPEELRALLHLVGLEELLAD